MTLVLWGAWAQGCNLSWALGLRNPGTKRPQKVGSLACITFAEKVESKHFLPSHRSNAFLSLGLVSHIHDDIQTVLTSGLHEKPFN